MGNIRRGWDNRRDPAPPLPAPGSRAPDEGRLIDLRDVPSRWPTMDGMVAPAPHAWRYRSDPAVLAAVDAFYRDLLWNTQLELDGVAWPGRAHRDRPSVLAALRDVARLWELPSAEEPLPAASAARQARNARRRESRAAPRTR